MCRFVPFAERDAHSMAKLKQFSREYKEKDTVINIGDITIGAKSKVIIAGPCAIESREQLLAAARIVMQGGADIFRGGAFKPRTSPYDFQGLNEKGLEYLAEVRDVTGMKVITEVIETTAVHVVEQYVDILQVGSRNMQNFPLLKAVGRSTKPVVLKRGMAATLDEWLLAAEYILYEGNQQVILCERGIRTFERYTRYTMDLSSIPVLKKLSHLPVIVDPSHATGQHELVSPMAMAALVSGADGLMLEVHPNPSEALCDGPQSLDSAEYIPLMYQLKKLEKFLHEVNSKKCYEETVVATISN